jgi:hypothetical protein
MKTISVLISWIIAQLGLSLICYIVYNLFLTDLFKESISFIQWFSIIVISSCIIPSGKILRSQNEKPDDKKEEKTNPLERYLSNFKNER